MTARLAFAAFARANRLAATRMGFTADSVAVVNGRKIEYTLARGGEFRSVQKIGKTERITYLSRMARRAMEIKDKSEYCFLIEQMKWQNGH